MTKLKSFVLYSSYREQIEILSDDEAGQLFKAILAYSCDEVIPEMDGRVELAFSFIKNSLDINIQKYKEKCEKNSRNAKKRWDKQDTQNDAALCERIFSDSNNDDENENKNENKNDNVCVNDNKQNTDSLTNDNTTKIFGINVRLTEQQYRALCMDYGESIVRDYINRVDSYLSNSGKPPYSNHYTTLSEWLRTDSANEIIGKSLPPKANTGEHSYDLDKLIAHAMNTTPKLPSQR